MSKIELMQKFMNTFTGKNIHLTIKENNSTFNVHTIEIIQKTDDTCPVKEIPVGDHFLHLIATNQYGNDASILCNWTEELLQNLLSAYKEAKDAEFSHITMCRDTLSDDPNRWLLLWGKDLSEPAIGDEYVSAGNAG
ncbi:hypothetical protein G4O51_05615 [Candidatus Bathyarchaeota archaeon A05DMB-2]|jgi:hypothetical protein|nr:hypothetical protein [Candidatus Bathyarchaeota archaeon A05DMB-2]